MALTQTTFREYDLDRSIVMFTAMNAETSVDCAITSEAMDRMESNVRTKPEQREAQFARLRDAIEIRLNQKFSESGPVGNPPRVILRSLDFPA